MRGLVFTCVLFLNCAAALEPNEVLQLLKKADGVKTSDNAEFAAILKRLDAASGSLSSEQLQYVRYLQGWQLAYESNYNAAVAILKPIIAETQDTTLRFRAYATQANVLAISLQYEEAFSQLGRLIELLPQISDRDARTQGLMVASLLYSQVGEYELASNYADMLLSENAGNRSVCIGGQLKLDALYRSEKLKAPDAELQSGVDACVKFHEFLFANLIRTYQARLYFSQGQLNHAIALLTDHLDEVQATRYPILMSSFDSLLAQAYNEKGDLGSARQFALRSIERGVKKEYTEPLVGAYLTLYEIAKKQGDVRSALAFHEKYRAADKGYLDAISARQLAYEKVKHDALAAKSQIDTLNKQNEVLKLKQELTNKAMETSRLYIAIITMAMIFIALFAYKTKRSQVHFRKLSRLDGLTGIFNRPHFIEQAEHVLADARKVKEDACVILCDLDHFKSINDKYGHPAGDSVLKQAAAVFQKHLRANDLVGRFGGEEFGFLLPGCSLNAARERCELIRRAIAEISVRERESASNISASFGIAATCDSGYELRQLLAHADKALYYAKRSGRNLVALYDMEVAQGVSAESAESAVTEDRTIRGAA